MAWFSAKAAAAVVLRRSEVQVLGVQGKTVTCRARVPFKPEEGGPLSVPIRAALDAAGLPAGAKLPVSIQHADILFRFFTIPAVPKAECNAAVQFEARRYIPFKIESLLWDYRAVPSPANPKRLDVIFAAMPKEPFARVQEGLSGAGVQATRIEPSHVSLARLADLSGAAGGEFVCIVDIDEDAAHLAIVKRRMPYLTRDISLLPSAETPPVAEWASPVGGEVGTPLSSLPPPVQEMDSRAKRLLSELSVSMDFFMRENPSTTIANVWLCGDESLIGPWCGWLAEQLRCSVQLARPLLQPHVPDDVPLSFASAVGLLAGVSEHSEESIDLLRGSAKPTAPRTVAAPVAMSVGALQEQAIALLKTPRTLMAACVAVGLLAGLWLLESMAVNERQRELAGLRSQEIASGLGLERMDQQALDDLRQRLDAQAAVIKRIIDGRASVATKLDGLARSLPDGVWITGLNFNNEFAQSGESQPRLMLSGSCFLGDAGKELAAIQRFETQLKQHEPFFNGFVSAQLNEITAQKKPQPPFTSYRTFLVNCAGRRRL